MEAGSQVEERQILKEHVLCINNLMRAGGMRKWTEREIQQESGLPDMVVKRCINLLLGTKYIVEAVNLDNKTETHYMHGPYANARDADLIGYKERCLYILGKLKVPATLETIVRSLRTCSYKMGTVVMSNQMARSVVMASLVEDGAVVEVQSDGMGEFSSIPVGEVCYKLL